MYEHRWVMERKFCDEIMFKNLTKSFLPQQHWLQREIYITSIYFNILCLIRAHLKREICSLVGWWWINKLHIISLDWKCIVRLLNVPYYLLLYAISIFFLEIEMKWGVKQFNFSGNSLEKLTNAACSLLDLH